MEETNGMPRTAAVTLEEGGEWWPFASGGHVGKLVHSIRFEDGRIWDSVNGWHPSREAQILAKLQVMFKDSCGASDDGALKLARKALGIIEGHR